MKGKLKSILLTTPDLFVFLKPIAFALKMIEDRPNAHACVACFKSIHHIDGSTTDRIIAFFNDTQTHITFVQIGSNDGKQGDPIYKYVSTSKKWNGVLVEPVGFLFSRLRENYSSRDDLVFEQALISTRRESRLFYYVSKEAKDHFHDLPPWHDQIGNFSMEFIVRHLGERIRPFIQSERIEAMTLGDLFAKHAIDAIDFLHIDTEGHDYEIIKQLQLRRIKPQIMIVEFKHLRYWECYRLINKLRRNYELFSSGGNLVAIEEVMAQQMYASNVLSWVDDA